MSFSRCLAVPSVAASGGFSSPSVYLAQVLFRNEVECRATGFPAYAYLHLGVAPPSTTCQKGLMEVLGLIVRPLGLVTNNQTPEREAMRLP
jgi:hypothetical protein